MCLIDLDKLATDLMGERTDSNEVKFRSENFRYEYDARLVYRDITVDRNAGLRGFLFVESSVDDAFARGARQITDARWPVAVLNRSKMSQKSMSALIAALQSGATNLNDFAVVGQVPDASTTGIYVLDTKSNAEVVVDAQDAQIRLDGVIARTQMRFHYGQDSMPVVQFAECAARLHLCSRRTERLVMLNPGVEAVLRTSAEIDSMRNLVREYLHEYTADWVGAVSW